MDVDYAAVAEGLQGAIPLNNHLGLRYVEVAPGRGVVHLPDEPHLRNHVGSQHAGALFTAGEAASGGAFVGAFLDLMADIVPLAEKADISYLRLAQGDITATGVLEESAQDLRARLESDGRVRFPIPVELTDGGGEVVARMTVHWYVKKRG